MTDPMIPVLLALASAVLFGVSSLTAKRGLAHVDAQSGSIIAMGTTVLIYAVLSPFWMQSSDWFTSGFWVFVVNGLIHPLLSMYMAFEATARTGPTIAATLSSTAPLFAALIAASFLGESISLLIAAGTLGTVAGVAALSWNPRGAVKIMRAALLFATGAAVIRGLNHVVGKWGLEMLPNVFMAAFVSFSVSLCGAVIFYRLRRGYLPLSMPRSALGYFSVTGTILAIAIACMYGALATGRVVVVSPLVASYPLFTLFAALLFGEDVITRRLVMGVLLVVGGVVFITLGSVT